MKNLIKVLFFGSFLLTILSCQSDDYQGPIPYPTLMETAESAGLTTLVAAVRAVPGLEATLQDQPAITVFAPTNDAFANALTAFKAKDLNELVVKIGGIPNLQTVLGFHVVPAVAFSKNLNATNVFTTLANQSLTVNVSSGVVTVIDAAGNTSRVIQADVQMENGVVHVIDKVLLPKIELPTIVEAATAANLTTLLQAVTAANLGGALLNAPAITVFAPTNQAFTSLLTALNLTSLQGLISALGAPAVSKVLQFHVVPAVAFSFDLKEGAQTVPTLAGEMLTVTKTGANVTVTDKAGKTWKVVTPNVAIKNGVVHVIDGVLLPTL